MSSSSQSYKSNDSTSDESNHRSSDESNIPKSEVSKISVTSRQREEMARLEREWEMFAGMLDPSSLIDEQNKESFTGFFKKNIFKENHHFVDVRGSEKTQSVRSSSSEDHLERTVVNDDPWKDENKCIGEHIGNALSCSKTSSSPSLEVPRWTGSKERSAIPADGGQFSLKSELMRTANSCGKPQGTFDASNRERDGQKVRENSSTTRTQRSPDCHNKAVQPLPSRDRPFNTAGDGQLDLTKIPIGDIMKTIVIPHELRSNKQHALKYQMSQLTEAIRQLTGVKIPSFYCSGAVNPLHYAEQMRKRKLLWSNKTNESTSTAKIGVAITEGQDQKTAEKFRKLLGIHGDACMSTDQKESSAIIKWQKETFQAFDREYEMARLTTHTHRGTGLGFVSATPSTSGPTQAPTGEQPTHQEMSCPPRQQITRHRQD